MNDSATLFLGAGRDGDVRLRLRMAKSAARTIGSLLGGGTRRR